MLLIGWNICFAACVLAAATHAQEGAYEAAGRVLIRKRLEKVGNDLEEKDEFDDENDRAGLLDCC